MDAGKTLGLCQPAAAILLVATAAVLYHLVAGNGWSIIWWITTGLFGTGVFQALCFGGMEPIAWILMSIPVLIVCFFLAVALFASRMRIDNVQVVPCNRCGHPKPKCGCGRPPAPPSCNRCGGSGCPHCPSRHEEGFADGGDPPCRACGRITCPYCQRVRRGNQCPYGRCECPFGGGKGLDCPYCPGAASLVAGVENFENASRACSSCQCMGGSCNGACVPGQCLDCDGSGTPNCTYQNVVVTGTQAAEEAGDDVAKFDY
jgi:hypothetical protein